MKRTHLVRVVACAAAVAAAGVAVATLETRASAQGRGNTQVPQLEVDRLWPQPFPAEKKWAIGSISGVAVDAQDHVWVSNRGVGSLQGNEKVFEVDNPANQSVVVSIDNPALTWYGLSLEFRATGLTTFHKEFAKENDKAYLLEARGRIDISRKTNVVALVSEERTQELRGALNSSVGASKRADIDMQRAALTFNHTFNRLSVQLRGSLVETEVGSTTDALTGAIITNNARNNTFREAAARATWAFKPTLQAFGAARRVTACAPA